MGNAVNALVSNRMDWHALQHSQQYFILPEIQQRHDIGVRQFDLARFISNEIVPRLVRLHTDVVPDAPPVEQLIDALRPSCQEIDALAHRGGSAKLHSWISGFSV